MSPKRGAVHEHRRVVFEGGGDLIVNHDAAHWQVAGCNALGEAHHVGDHVEAFDAEPFSESAEGADDRVGDEEDAVSVADLSHSAPVVGGRNEAAPGVLHGLQDHGRDEIGAFGLDHLLDGISRAFGVLLGVPDVEEARRQRLEGRLEAWQSRHGERSHRRAVVGHVPGDDLVPSRLTIRLVVLPGQLDHGLNSLRSR